MRPSRRSPQNESSVPNNMCHKHRHLHPIMHHRPHLTRPQHHHPTYHSLHSTNRSNRDGDMCPAAAIQVMAMVTASILTVDAMAYTVPMEDQLPNTPSDLQIGREKKSPRRTESSSLMANRPGELTTMVPVCRTLWPTC